jgi:hypothetical protein
MELKLLFPETDVHGIGDPFGNIIFIAEDFTILDFINQDLDQLIETVAVLIEKPIYIIKIGSTDLYYFRRVKSNTILVHCRFMNLEWKAIKMIRNPDPEYIFSLLKRGRLFTSFD